jgi:glycosyltransferase involved in cell wall biosynthesis
MKIILANKFFYPRGGDCIHTMQLKDLLEQHGHEVAIFSMQYSENCSNEYSNYWPSEVVFNSKSPIKMLSAIARPFGVSEVKKKWTALLKSFNPDIVHVHNIHSQLSPVIAQIAKKNNIPVVWTLHDYKLICPAYTCMDMQGNVCEDCFANPKPVVTKRCIKDSMLGSYLGYFEANTWNRKNIEKSTSVFISPSKFLKNKMEQAGYNPSLIQQLYNFADKAKFSIPVVEKRNKNCVYLGRLSKEKGIETLCKVFQNETNANLVIIGDGPLKHELEKKYASKHIHFIGFKPWKTIKDMLGNAVCMIIPSEWYENNPLTVIESFALGTPVIGARIGGIPELIDEGVNGFTFSPGDEKDLSLKINKMVSDASWNYKLIQKNASNIFSQDIYYNKLMSIYNEIKTK